MTLEERQLIEALFERLGRVKNRAYDAEAAALIYDKIKENPSLACAMAQTILVQNQALATAEARMVNLMAREARHGGEGGEVKRISTNACVGAAQSGFLASAAATALSVAGGGLLGDTLRGIFDDVEEDAAPGPVTEAGGRWERLFRVPQPARD